MEKTDLTVETTITKKYTAYKEKHNKELYLVLESAEGEHTLCFRHWNGPGSLVSGNLPISRIDKIIGVLQQVKAEIETANA